MAPTFEFGTIDEVARVVGSPSGTNVRKYFPKTLVILIEPYFLLVALAAHALYIRAEAQPDVRHDLSSNTA